MKRLLIIIIAASMLLSGCSSIYINYREVEQMLVVETMGLDLCPKGILLSLAPSTGNTAIKPPSCLSGTGNTITTAMERIRNYSCEEELFSGHINHVIIGESAARNGLDHYLSYICSAPNIRIDMPMFILKGGTAAEAMSYIGTDNKGISEILRSIQANLDDRADGYVFSSADVVRNLERNGSALVCALEYHTAAESAGEKNSSDNSQESASGSEEEKSIVKTVSAAGYGILRGSKLCAFADMDQAIGAAFIMGKIGLCDIDVQDQNGSLVTLEIESGSCDINPSWDDSGNLYGINISVNVKASVVEIAGSGDLNDAGYANYLTAQLEAAVSEKISSVLQLSRRLGADFLGLGEKVELKSPREYRAMNADFSRLLPSLELRISVSGDLSHTNDIKDA